MNSLEALKLPKGELLYSEIKKKTIIGYTSKQIEEIDKVYARCFELEKDLKAYNEIVNVDLSEGEEILTQELQCSELHESECNRIIDLTEPYFKKAKLLEEENYILLNKNSILKNKVKDYIYYNNSDNVMYAMKLLKLEQEIQSLLGGE